MLHPPRLLSNNDDYISSNCSLSNYGEKAGVDNLTSTWATNYLIGAIGFLAVGHLLLVRTTSPKNLLCLIAYFLLTAVGYTLAGVYHHVIDDTNDKNGNALYYSSVGLTILAMPWLEVTLTDNAYLRMGIVLSNLAVFVVLVALFMEAVAGFWFLVSFFVMAILYGYRRKFLRAFAAVLFVTGFLVLGIFSSACSGSAEKDCFKDCPLPSPTVFNQNGLFHVFVALGVLCQWVAEATDPTGSPSAPQEADKGRIKEEEEEEDNISASPSATEGLFSAALEK
jgi:predicted membrane channel-forming protein YqfA (hemolysin III family)